MIIRRKQLRVATVAVALSATWPAFAQSRTDGDGIGTFNDALAASYRALEAVEREQGDNRDADAYAARAAAAASGNPAAPEPLAERAAYLEEQYVSDLATAHERLTGALDKQARSLAPRAAARAQTAYDCWLEQASEDLQPEHIAACRDAYMLAMGEVEEALKPRPVATPEPPPPPAPPVEPEVYRVYFAFDDARLDAAANAVIDDVKADLDGRTAARIRIVGWASTVGAGDYNERLSRRRSEAVRERLVDIGVAAESISLDARGETDLPVPTGDGVREPRNRQVAITVVAAP